LGHVVGQWWQHTLRPIIFWPALAWRAPKLLVSLKDEPKVENNGKVKSSGHAPWFSTL
jgi:hypothetical protein